MGACIGACFAGICCGMCGQCKAVQSGPISRLPYLFLFIAAGIFSLIMSIYGEERLDLVFYDTSICPVETCEGTGSVYRTSFILFVFEVIHVLIIACGAVAFHWLFFSWKVIIFIICLVLTFVIETENSNAFFQGYANYFCRWVSAFYLILQILILIIWSYENNEMLRDKVDSYYDENRSRDADEDEQGSCVRNPWAWLLASVTVIFYALSFTILGLFYHWYAPHEVGCQLNIALITVTIILCICNAVFSFIRADGSFFVSSAVSLYATFLLFAGLQSMDNPECNVLQSDNEWSLWIGYVISFLSIGYAALRADRIGLLTYEQYKQEGDANAKQVDANGGAGQQGGYSEVNATLKADTDDEHDEQDIENQAIANNEEKDAAVNSKQILRIQHTFFHIILMLASCYYSMLFTNWANSRKIDTKGEASLWVNMASQWACILLFWWTLAAPLICPGRFASDEEDDE